MIYKFVVKVEIDTAWDSADYTNTSLDLFLWRDVHLEVLNRVKWWWKVLELDNFTVLLELNVWDCCFTACKFHLGKVYDMLWILNDHEKELIFLWIGILKETMKFVVVWEFMIRELSRLGDDLDYLIAFAASLKADDVDIVIICQEKMLLAQPNMAV